MENKNTNYRWQGTPCKVEFGYCTISNNEEKPLYWYNYEVFLGHGKAIIEAVRVTQGNSQFVLSNHNGIGVHKLINGGWPGYAHFSLDKETFKPETLLEMFENYHYEFDLDNYELHEASRRAWQKKEYPVEFEKSESLRRLILNK